MPDTALAGAVSTFAWSSGAGAQEYYLYVGTAQGTHDIWGASTGKATAAVVSNLPLNGSTVYDRLWTRLAPPSGWVYNDYTYTARQAPTFAAAAIVTPGDQATLQGASVDFTWTAGTGVAEYWLSLGTTSSGTEPCSASQGVNLQATVSNLPTDGSTVYAHLWSRQVGSPTAGWTRTDVSYTAATAATPVPPSAGTISSPSNGSTLAGSTVGLTITAGPGVSQYWLFVGTTLGGRDLYSGSLGTNLAPTVSGLPSNGSTVYVRLWSLTAAGWLSNDYSFTAAS